MIEMLSDLPIWVWIVIVCSGVFLFAMTFGFYATSLLLVGVVGFIAWKTWEIASGKK